MSHQTPATMVPRSPLHYPDRNIEDAGRETIALRAMGSKLTIDAVVLSKRPERIHVMLNEGAHRVFCELKPTADSLAYVGTSLGRDVVYQRTRVQVEADIAERGAAETDAPAW